METSRLRAESTGVGRPQRASTVGRPTAIGRARFQTTRPPELVAAMLFWWSICTLAAGEPQLNADQAAAPANILSPISARLANMRGTIFEQTAQVASRQHPIVGSSGNASKEDGLESFLQTLPILSVGQKHRALFECELDERHAASRLAWIRLDLRANETSSIKPISLDLRLISPDRRFKVHRQSALKWLLSLDQVSAQDHQAYFLCQPSAEPSAGQAHRAGFVNGAQLHVLVPPKMVEEETSPSLVQADEWAALSLRCKVSGEPRSELTWKREDGRPIETGRLSFRHQLERRPNQLVSMDSSELHFASFERQQAGAYLCIASNGVQPGVSQRINVRAVNCRQSSRPDSPAEQCEPATATATATAPAEPASSTRPPTNWRQRPAAELAKRRPASANHDKRRNGRTEAKSGAELANVGASSSAMRLISSAGVFLNRLAPIISCLFVILAV